MEWSAAWPYAWIQSTPMLYCEMKVIYGNIYGKIIKLPIFSSVDLSQDAFYYRAENPEMFFEPVTYGTSTKRTKLIM